MVATATAPPPSSPSKPQIGCTASPTGLAPASRVTWSRRCAVSHAGAPVLSSWGLLLPVCWSPPHPRRCRRPARHGLRREPIPGPPHPRCHDRPLPGCAALLGASRDPARAARPPDEPAPQAVRPPDRPTGTLPPEPGVPNGGAFPPPVPPAAPPVAPPNPGPQHSPRPGSMTVGEYIEQPERGNGPHHGGAR